MKVIKTLICLFCCIILLSSCSKADTVVISLNGNNDITADVFSYYLKREIGRNKGLTEQNYLDGATNECIKSIAAENYFNAYGMKLTPQQKAEISKETNRLWHQYGEYYSYFGLTKQTLYKIQTAEQYKESVRFYLYDTGGPLAVDENQIKTVFNETYCGFRFVYDYLYYTDESGQLVKKSEDEINGIYTDYVNAANSINNKGSNLEEAYASFATDEAYNSLSLDTVVISKNNGFPDGFYDNVRKAQNGQAIVIISDDYIYLVVREDILSADLSAYNDRRKECLVKLTDSLLDSQLASWANEYNAVRKLSKAKNCYSLIQKADKKAGDTNE